MSNSPPTSQEYELARLGHALHARVDDVVEAMLARGIIILSGGVERNVLSFTPPCVIAEEEIDFALGQLAEVES